MLLAIGCGADAAYHRSNFDFDFDGKDDILWRDAATGANVIWLMNGQKVALLGLLNVAPDQAWQLQGIGDFDGDGMADILWRNPSTGENTIYLMNGWTIAAQGLVNVAADDAWQVLGIGDFDGDGKADILWRNPSTGEVSIYLMNGWTVGAQGVVSVVTDPALQVQGVGDFNGDGRADILWRNSSTGENTISLMNGLTIASQGTVSIVDPASGWQVKGIGDFDRDGKADILWRNSASGENYLYPMDGTTIKASQGFLRTIADLNWQVQAVADYNGDGRADILWRNSATGESYLSLSATAPEVPPLPLVLWSASMEIGGLGEWSEKVNSGSADSTVVSAESVGIPPKDGSYVMMQAVTGADGGGTRMQRYPEVNLMARAGTTFYWSWWDYFPTRISFGPADIYSIFQIASRDSDGVSSPIWSFNLQSSDFTLLLFWSPNNMAGPGPHAGESGRRYYTSTQPIPVGQWVFFEVMITPSSGYTGALKVWMNDQVLFDLTDIKTRFPDVGAGGLMYTTQNAYGSGLTPTPAVHYVDEVTLSLGRMPYSP